MGNPEIEGSWTLLPPPGFFTRAKASFAIAMQLHPDDTRRRDEVAQRFDTTIFDALCNGQLVGRDPDSRLPIERRDLAGALMLSGCLISEVDLNTWAAARGIGISIGCAPSRERSPLVEPSPEELLAEKHQMTGPLAGRCNVTLAKKYGITPRRVKYLCSIAGKHSKPKSGTASSSFFQTQYVHNGKRAR